MSEAAPPLTPKQIFTELSVRLTGFDRAELAGTGMIDTYYDTLLRIIGEREAGQLFRYAAEALAADRQTGDGESDAALKTKVIENPRFAPIAVSLIKLWYLGSWYPLAGDYRDENGSTADDVEHVVSAQGYREGLVWTAAGAHPMGAKPPGFGSWSEPPTLIS
ncbi:hypothetical protein SAMN04487983_106411 [Streptomyces sp. yr375]|uniref:hypothetical protein n=1 Tax=Streptomyces sp. yr375 TaxID=1761906 RepID=UPI0008B5B29E|nr:hypothetical protein [Streptomyces sp. yr375]SES47531.1 hypothetical protein SAMN04487983_106411 [Streptomyces sp. yr375]